MALVYRLIEKRFKVLQSDMSGNFIKEYRSVIEASEELSINKSTLYKCLCGLNKSSGGFKWEYK